MNQNKELAGELSQELAKSLKPEADLRPFDGLAFHHVEREMAELGELLVCAIEKHEAAKAALQKPPQHLIGQLTAELEESQAELTAIENQMLRYMATEIRKVDSIAGYYRYLQTICEMFCKEEDRITRRRRSVENAIERLKNYGKRVMEEAGQERIQGDYSRLRLQNNSSERVEIPDLGAVPPEYITVTVRLSLSDLNMMESYFIKGHLTIPRFQTIAQEPNLSDLAGTLKHQRAMIVDAQKKVEELEAAVAVGADVDTETRLLFAKEHLDNLHATELQCARLVRGKHLRIE